MIKNKNQLPLDKEGFLRESRCTDEQQILQIVPLAPCGSIVGHPVTNGELAYYQSAARRDVITPGEKDLVKRFG